MLYGDIAHHTVLIQESKIRIEQRSVAGFHSAQTVNLIPGNGCVKSFFLCVVTLGIAKLYAEAFVSLHGETVMIVSAAPNGKRLGVIHKHIPSTISDPIQRIFVGKLHAGQLYFCAIVRFRRVTKQVKSEGLRRSALVGIIPIC